MSAPLRLAVFAAALTFLFGAAFGIGRVLDVEMPGHSGTATHDSSSGHA